MNALPKPPDLPLRVKTIDALQRGLLVLRAIQAEKAISLSDLHRLTNIPRATLLRILKTLCDDGWVTRHPLTKRFTSKPSAAAYNIAPWHDALSQLCAPIRKALERRIPWPVNIAVPDGSQMVILDAQSTCSLTPNYHALGYRPSMLDSAVGRCYLAFCPTSEREGILRRLERSGLSMDITPHEMQTILQSIRDKGYSLRTRRGQGVPDASDYSALAIPLWHSNRVIGAITMVWLSMIVSDDDMLKRYQTPLSEAARTIELELKRTGIEHISQLT